jgi:hypothetical protein
MTVDSPGRFLLTNEDAHEELGAGQRRRCRELITELQQRVPLK